MRKLSTFCCLLALLFLTPAVHADQRGVPDPNLSEVVLDATWQISALNCPSGDGGSMDDCIAYGGEHIPYGDIRVYLHDAYGDPIIMYPAMDLWLESADGGMVACVGGTIADMDTDVNGMTTFTNPLYAGGWSTAGIVCMVSGMVIAQPPLDILVNSPDINGDLVVNLADIVEFTVDYYGPYSYRSDFYWDGDLNLTDIVILARHLTHECP